MSLIYITGIAGSGKSEVYNSLKKRDLEVYGTDEDQLAGFYNNKTGIRVDNPSDVGIEATPEWRSRHTWKLLRQVIENLKNDSKNKTVFLCGVASNEEKFLELFDKLFALVIDKETLLHRIESRTNNSFGKNEVELKQIIEWQTNTSDYYEKYNYVTLDATQPVETIVDKIIDITEDHS